MQTIGLVTDVHIGPEASYCGKLRKLSNQAEPLLEAFVERMNRVVRPDLVVNLGDAIEDVDAETDRRNYARLVEILSGVEAPVLHVAGNHDLAHLGDAELAALQGHAGDLYYVRDLGPFRCIVLCTHETSGRHVMLPEGQLGWLEQRLAEAPGPCLVFVHHPLCEMRLDSNRWFSEHPELCRVGNRRQVRRLLEASGKVRAVFNGHAHWHYCNVISGIPYLTLQSLIENVDDDAPGRAAAASAVVRVESRRLAFETFGLEPVRYQFDQGPRLESATP